MELLILSLLFATSLAAPAAQSLTFNDDGSYRFYYETGEEGGSHSRTEVRNPDGVVIGKFSYQDPDGEMREVNYRADNSGFVAHGDVGVKGAPKGQFPAVQDDKPEEPVSAAPSDQQPKKQSKEPNTNENLQAKSAVDEAHHYDDDDDMQDLTFHESAALDDPPEGFPPGFFLQHYQGLRRLPEPTKKPTSTEAPSKANKFEDQEVSTKSPTAVADKPEENATEPPPIDVKAGAPELFPVLRPFHGLNPQEWATAMFHQPVYVFAYNQPDSYGYHYYF